MTKYLIFGEIGSGKSQLIAALLQHRIHALDLEAFVPTACLDPNKEYIGWTKIMLTKIISMI